MNVARANGTIKFVSNKNKQKKPNVLDGGESEPPVKSLSQGINFVLGENGARNWIVLLLKLKRYWLWQPSMPSTEWLVYFSSSGWERYQTDEDWSYRVCCLNGKSQHWPILFPCLTFTFYGSYLRKSLNQQQYSERKKRERQVLSGGLSDFTSLLEFVNPDEDNLK